MYFQKVKSKKRDHLHIKDRYLICLIVNSDSLLRIRIHQIHTFLGLQDPDPGPLVRGTMDPDPAPDLDPSIIKQK
jgi:hypothetical protein